MTMEAVMLKLLIKDILKEQNHTTYWLYKQFGLSYQNLSKIMNNEASVIRFEPLDALCKILDYSICNLFEYILDDIKWPIHKSLYFITLDPFFFIPYPRILRLIPLSQYRWYIFTLRRPQRAAPAVDRI